MTPPIDDKSAILRRRALFLGSTLAALGACAKQGPPAEHASGPVVSLPSPQAEDAGPAEDLDAAKPDTARARPDTLGDLPPLDPPAGVSDTARQRYERLAQRMTSAHKILSEAQAMLPACSIASCEADWQALVEKMYELEQVFRFSYECPGSSADAKAYGERSRQHQEYYDARRRRVDEAIANALGVAGKARYDELYDKVRAAHPMPCLSIACKDW